MPKTTAPVQVSAEEALSGALAGEASGFAIDNLERLEWYGRKRTAKLAEIAAIEANAAALIKSLRQNLADFEAHFGPQAEEFARQTLEATGWKTKTLKTFGGAFSFRTVNGGLRKTDGAALVTWAKENAPDLVVTQTTVKEDVPADAIKAFIERRTQETGEIILPPGLEIAPDRQTFTHKAEV